MHSCGATLTAVGGASNGKSRGCPAGARNEEESWSWERAHHSKNTRYQITGSSKPSVEVVVESPRPRPDHAGGPQGSDHDGSTRHILLLVFTSCCSYHHLHPRRPKKMSASLWYAYNLVPLVTNPGQRSLAQQRYDHVLTNWWLSVGLWKRGLYFTP